MPTERRCEKCGAALAPFGAEALCPKCMLLEAVGLGADPSTQARAAAAVVTPVTEKPGDKIGRYKLLQQIGDGGMGVVYMAEQEEPVRRRVALKVIKLGMDTKSVIARFEAERQALALMDHPNIAKVLDAGATDTGRPYFVMELVRGIRITDYCDQNHLSTQQRLDLFTQICKAIQHAHQKGIIHRDIKPSNILVTLHDGMPVPKIIDFGIAKAASDQRLTDKTLFTAFQQFIGTPAYMSPEQAEMSGLDIDTRSDIYSLGVLLYELLTGRTPFDANELLRAGLDEMRRIIREVEPVKPSTRLTYELTTASTWSSAKGRKGEKEKGGLDAGLGSGSPPPPFPSAPFPVQSLEEHETSVHRLHQLKERIPLLRGDLDWIVMKALEKDRARRYESANGLAMDIQRHLDNEPVAARPPSAAYRFQKLVRRNKLAFAAASAVAAALTIGLGASTWQFFKEKAARQRAVAAEKAQSELRLQAQTEAKKSQQVAQFLADMLEGVGPSRAKGRDAVMLREILDETAKRVGRDLKDQPEVEADLRIILGKTYADLGLTTNALEMTQEALRLRRLHLSPTNTAVADALANLGVLLYDAGDLPGAEKMDREALAMRIKLLGKEHTNVAMSLNNLGVALWNQSKLDEAEDVQLRALEIRRKLLPADHPHVGMSLLNLANVQGALGRYAGVETNYAAALELFKKSSGSESPIVAILQNNLATLLGRRGDLAAAAELHEKTMTLRKKLFKADHPHLAVSLTQLGIVLATRGDLDGAEARLQEAVAMQDRMRLGKHSDVADALAGLGIVLTKKGDWAVAEGKNQQALAMRIEVLKGEENADVVDSLDALAVLAIARGDFDEAEQKLVRAVEDSKKSDSKDYPGIIPPLWHLAWVLEKRGDPTNADARRREALAISSKHGDYGAWPLLRGIYDLTDVLQKLGKFTEAEPLFAETATYAQNNLADSVTLQRDTFQRLMLFYEAWDRSAPNTGKTSEAAAWRKKLEKLEPQVNQK